MPGSNIPDDDTDMRLARVARAQAADHRGSPSELVLIGRRSDLAEGYGPRWRVGFDGAGNLVEQRWNATGGLTTAVYA